MDNDIILTPDEKRRYSRNIMLPEIGPDGQKKLLRSKVLVVGCGALGSVAALYLAGSGVGEIGLVDFDTVDLSNLQRQLPYRFSDVGRPKADVLAESVECLNPAIKVKATNGLLTKKNACKLIGDYDIVVEGSDNPDTKYLVAEECRKSSVPCVIGGISGVSGQVLTFVPGHASYCDVFPEAAPTGSFTPCALGGVLGPLPGIIGSIQAAEVIKLITGFGQPLIDAMLLVDASTMNFTRLQI